MAIVITVAQQKGGAGKSTISAHLAVAFSQGINRVALIDIDPQGSTTNWYDIRETKYGEGYTGITFVKASGLRLANEISRLRATHDIIIIDSPPHVEAESRAAIRAADLIIVPVQPSPTDVWAMSATIDLCEREGKVYRVLLNRYTPGSKIAKELDSAIPTQRLNAHFGNRVVFASSMVSGRCVTESDPTSTAAEEVKAVVAEINHVLIKEGLKKEELAAV
ncbi:MAG: cobyrinic acid a,c-diamide synthase [Rickettsiaceae bacterium]|jgi:chromosome partitioning protein|nr:cobyrinic acid a,c-diamide synthase [Rickettsiaceae bacterium]